MMGKVSQDTGLEKRYFTYPKKEYGDLAYTEAIKLSKESGTPVEETAKPFIEKFKKLGYVREVTLISGYVNLKLDFGVLFSEFLTTRFSGWEFKPSFEKKKEKVIVEHTSVNPNAPPHIGRARNACIGATLAELLREYGYDVEVQYYINDIGKQVSTLVYGCMGKDIESLKPEDLLKIYVETSKQMDEETEKKVIELQKQFESGDKEIRMLFRKVVNKALKAQMSIFSRIGAEYDKFVYESDFLEESFELLEKIKSLKQVNIRGNVVSVDLSEYGIEKELVLTRSDGSTLYPLRDIVYHIKKLEAAEINYGVYGSDHKLHFEQLKKVLEMLGYDVSGIKYIFYEHVLLPEGKMSTRKGTLVLLSEFLDTVEKKAWEETQKRWGEVNPEIPKKIAEACVRYTIGKVDPKKKVIFDLNKAINFEGDSGVYIQYTYARAGSVLEKAGKFTVPKEFKGLIGEEKELIKYFWTYEDIIKESVEQLKPDKIYHFIHDFCETFNKFYSKCPVLNSEEPIKSQRLCIVKVFREVLGRCMDIAGIPRLERI